MDTQKLIYFHYVARHLNFSKAAEECHIAQTAMSRCIANLEDELGFKLFDRSRHHVLLTPAGQSFRDDTADIMGKLHIAQDRAHGISKNYLEFLSIGFGSYERPFLMRHVESFRKLNPQTSISIYHLPSDEILDYLLSERCGVVYGPTNRLGYVKNARTIRLHTSVSSIAVSVDNPLSKKEYITPAMLEGRTLVCPIGQGSMLLNQFRQRCAAIGFTPGEIICTNNAEALFTTVELDLAIAIIPDHLNLDYNTKMRLIKLVSPHNTFSEHLAVGFVQPGSGVIKRFLDHVELCVSGAPSLGRTRRAATR